MKQSVSIMRHEKRERNIELATRMLLGESPVRLAQEYGICADNSYRIVCAYCFRVDRDVYDSLRSDCSRPKLKDLREHVDIFLNAGCDEPVTLHSPLWRVEGGTNKIVNTLQREGIDTIGDLLEVESDKLIKIPFVGPVMRQELKSIVDRYRYLLDERFEDV